MTTLAELRAQNAAEEKRLAGKTPENEADGHIEIDMDKGTTLDVVVDKDTPIQDEDTLEGADTQEGGDTVEGADTTVTGEDDWMKPEDAAAVDTSKLSNSDWKALRLKYIKPAKEAEAQAEQLRKENEDLRKKLEAKPAATASDKPKRDDFASEDEYLEALTDYKINHVVQNSQSQQAAAQQKARQEQQAAETEKEVEAHYTRAAALAAKSKIKPEVYQAADLNVRKVVATIFGDAADAVTDTLIARVGAGSEKALYFIGVNPSKQAELMEAFKKDPTGLGAAVYITRLAERLNTPKAKESKAPEPQDEIRGDNQRGTGMGGKMKKDWEAAHKSGDTQLAISIRRKAQNAKVDVSSWQ